MGRLENEEDVHDEPSMRTELDRLMRGEYLTPPKRPNVRWQHLTLISGFDHRTGMAVVMSKDLPEEAVRVNLRDFLVGIAHKYPNDWQIDYNEANAVETVEVQIVEAEAREAIERWSASVPTVSLTM